MFFARWDQGAPWEDTIDGTVRWLRRVWSIILEPGARGEPSPGTIQTLRRKVHQTLKSITRDYDVFEFNTIVSSLMELLNEMSKAKSRLPGAHLPGMKL